MSFHVFDIASYYPGGGFNDWVGSFDTFQEALTFLLEHAVEDSAEIVDIPNGSKGPETLYVFWRVYRTEVPTYELASRWCHEDGKWVQL